MSCFCHMLNRFACQYFHVSGLPKFTSLFTATSTSSSEPILTLCRKVLWSMMKESAYQDVPPLSFDASVAPQLVWPLFIPYQLTPLHPSPLPQSSHWKQPSSFLFHHLAIPNKTIYAIQWYRQCEHVKKLMYLAPLCLRRASQIHYHGCTVLLVLLWYGVKISVVYLYTHNIYLLLRFMRNMAIM